MTSHLPIDVAILLGLFMLAIEVLFFSNFVIVLVQVYLFGIMIVWPGSVTKFVDTL